MLRFVFRLILLALVLLLILIIFAPNAISTKWGKSAFFKAYQALTGKTLTAEVFEISWWKGQSFENITVKYPKDQIVFTSQKITTDATLWQLVFFNDLGTMEMTSPKVIMTAELPLPMKKRLAQAGFIPHFAVASSWTPGYLGHLRVQNGEAQFLTQGFDPIQLQNVNLDATLLKNQIKLKGSGQTLQKNITGNFDVDVTAQQSQIDLMANLKNFPMRSLDQTAALFYPDLRGVLLESIGEAVNVQLKLKNLPETLELFCDATSKSFSAHIETQTQNNTVTLAAPAVIQFQVPKAFIQKMTKLPLQNSFQGQLKIDNLSLPLANRESFSFQATLKGETLTFPFGIVQPFGLFISTNDFSKRNFILKIDSPQAQFSSSVYFPDDLEKATFSGEGLFPGNTKIDFNAQTLSSITANVQGDHWKASLQGGFDPHQSVVFLTKPADITYQVDQLPAPLPPLLKQPLTVHGQVKPLKVSLAQMSGPVSFQIKTEPTNLGGIPVGETTISATGDLKTQKGTFDLTSSLGSGTVNASGTFGYPNDLAAKINLANAPTPFLDLFLTDLKLTPLVGPQFSAHVDLNTQRQFSFDFSSDVLTAQASLEKTGSMLKLTKPAKLTFTLTPEGYLALDKAFNKTSSPFVLSEPAVVKATIPVFSSPMQFKLTEAVGTADLTLDTLAFAGRNSTKATQLKNLQLHLERTGAPFVFNLTASGSPEGSLNLQGKGDANNLELNGKLDQFPTDALDAVARAVGKSPFSYAALFGSKVSVGAQASLYQGNGPVRLEVRSPNIQASLNGALAQGMVTLKETFHMQMSLTPDLSKLLLSYVNPLSLSGISSEAPITLEIPAPGFSYPLSGTKINIPSGRLELGKLYCHNEGNVNIALGLLKLSQFSQNQSLELWFAPLDFHIKDGVLDCERTEILVASAYQICCWGNIDFVSRDVDMVLGLTANCLKAAFGISNLPDNYVLQIPMRGTLDNVKINSSKATAKIAALLLWQQNGVGKAFGNKPGGDVLGKFINKLGPLPDADSKAPPAKRPFPWESAGSPAAKKKKTSEASKNKKHIVPDEQALKQVLKMLQ